MTPHHHQLRRTHSNQHQLVTREAAGFRKVPKTLQQIGRQQSFQGRPSLLSNQVEGLRFHPNPAIANGNGQVLRGAMKPMAQPTQLLMTSLGKGMTYSLDRRQVKRVPRQNSQQGFQIYNQLNNGV